MPHHFLLTGGLMSRFGGFLLPPKRPTDNVGLGWDRPQEDEFALCNMGIPSPYLRMAFPNDPPVFMEYLDMEGIPEPELARWKEALVWFVRAMTYRRNKQLVLKSPPHTGRVEILSQMFPGAKFVHLARSPYDLFDSTVRLWKSWNEVQGFQWSQGKNLPEYVFDSLDRMYRGFWKQEASIDSSSICQVRYEDLLRDPVGQLEAVYQKLDAGDFEAVRPKLQQYVESGKSFKTNPHTLDDSTRDEITRRWAEYIRRYDY